jgi:hypothetical protein
MFTEDDYKEFAHKFLSIIYICIVSFIYNISIEIWPSLDTMLNRLSNSFTEITSVLPNSFKFHGDSDYSTNNMAESDFMEGAYI